MLETLTAGGGDPKQTKAIVAVVRSSEESAITRTDSWARRCITFRPTFYWSTGRTSLYALA